MLCLMGFHRRNRMPWQQAEAMIWKGFKLTQQFKLFIQDRRKWTIGGDINMLKISFIVILCAASVFGQASNPIKDLVTPWSWRNLEFGFPSGRERQDAIAFGFYRSDSVIPLDVGASYAGRRSSPRYFVTIPRFGDGVPYSVAEVTNVTRRNGPLLTAYPSYDWHNSNGNDCDGITSAFRLAIDECDRMWIMDSGSIGFQQLCPPQLVVIDLNTDEELDRYEIPSNMYKSGTSILVTPVVDVLDPPPGICKKTIVYIADSTGRAIIVYNTQKRRSWRIENAFTGPDGRFSTHTIAGESFQMGDGVFGMSLTPRSLNIERFLYFHALASDTEIAVPLKAVNRRKIWRDWNGGSDQFRVLGSRGIQCTQEAISSDGYHFCAYNNPIGLFAWDIRTPYDRSNQYLVAHNPDTLQFVGGLKIVRNPRGEEEVVMLSNRLQKYYSKTMNYNEINFRIQTCRVKDLISGAECRSYL